MLKKLLVSVVITITAQSAWSGTVSGNVSRLYPSSGGSGNPDLVYFKISGDACKADSGYWYFALQSEASKAWFSMLLAAATTRSDVIVAFNGACNQGVSQEVTYIYQNF